MKKIFFLSVVFLASLSDSFAQKLMKVVYIKDGAVTSNPKDATLLIAIRSVDGHYERNDYEIKGPLRRVKTFKDRNQTILEGNYLEYNKDGMLQLAGYYTNNVKSGRWHYFNDSGIVTRTEDFEGTGVFDIPGSYYDTTILPSFKGGKNGWRNFLHETLDRDAMTNMLKDEEVKISFLVSESGSLTNFIIFRSEYFVVDNEFIRVLTKTPKWNPGTRNGIPVSFRITQNLLMLDTFHEQ